MASSSLSNCARVTTVSHVFVTPGCLVADAATVDRVEAGQIPCTVMTGAGKGTFEPGDAVSCAGFSLAMPEPGELGVWARSVPAENKQLAARPMK